jgi:DNA-binding winged helix-turn-helix (wHTH) protein/TolB-like protein/Tfp pilus assembly protein PilF
VETATKRPERQHQDAVSRRKFLLGDVEVRPRSGTVSGPGGERKLDPKVMQVLVHLAAADNAIVSRDYLMDNVWGGVVVTDFALSRCIYQLRKNLSEAAGSDISPIETLPKRGYRLVWPVTRVSRTKKERSGHRIRLVSAAAVLVLVAAAALLFTGLRTSDPSAPEGGEPPATTNPVRLVILPLDDTSDDAKQASFAEGLTGEIAHVMAGIPGIIVVGSLSSANTDFSNTPVMKYARGLDADFVLGGSVSRIGETRRVMQYMVRVDDEEQLWSKDFLVEPGALFTVAGDIAWETADRLRFTVDPSSLRGSTENLQAFERFLASFDAASLEARRLLLEQAVEIDPGYARAWNRRAAIEVMPVWNGETTVEEAWARAEPFVRKALEIDPGFSDAYVTLARFKREFGQMEEAADHLYHALELEPGNLGASGNLGLVLRFMGDYEGALAIHEADAQIDPLSAVFQVRLGTSNWFMDQHAEAERRYHLASELASRWEETYDSWAAMLALGPGRMDLALEMIERKIEVEGEPTPRTWRAASSWADALGLQNKALEYRMRLTGGEEPGPDPKHYLLNGDYQQARLAAGEVLANSPSDTSALLALAAVEKATGLSGDFSERVLAAFPGVIEDKLHANPRGLEVASLVALAYRMSGQQESASVMLRKIVDAIPQPRSPQHVYLAAALAMQGYSVKALARLRNSPPGRVRFMARMLPLDPRFESLWRLPEFSELIAAHVAEIDLQRADYMARNHSVSIVKTGAAIK